MNFLVTKDVHNQNQQSRLGIKNLDCLIFVINNWPNNGYVGFDETMKPKDMSNNYIKFMRKKNLFENNNYEFD